MFLDLNYLYELMILAVVGCQGYRRCNLLYRCYTFLLLEELYSQCALFSESAFNRLNVHTCYCQIIHIPSFQTSLANKNKLVARLLAQQELQVDKNNGKRKRK